MSTAVSDDASVVNPSVESEDTAVADSPNAEPVATLDRDDLFHVLQNERRRQALAYLSQFEVGERVEMRDIAEQVAAWEHDTTLQQLTSSERQRVYIALYQSHLPKLDELGAIEYDQSRGHVERTELSTEFDPYLGASEETDEEPNEEASADDAAASHVRSYGAATGVAGSLILATQLGAMPGTLATNLNVLVAGLFLVVTLSVALR